MKVFSLVRFPAGDKRRRAQAAVTYRGLRGSGFGERDVRGRILVLSSLLVSVVLTTPAAGDEPAIAWRTGAAFDEQLAAPVPSLTWGDTPLREALASLAVSQRVAILLDRRVDPGRRIQFSSADRSLEETTRALAAHLDLGICLIGDVVYLGPPATAAVLDSVAVLREEEAAKYPRELAASWTTPRPSHWEMLSKPRELLAGLAEEGQADWSGLEAIPHDLWAEASWPPLTLPVRLSLVLAGFDRTYRFDPDTRRLELVPLPPEASLTRHYRPTSTQRPLLERRIAATPGAEGTVTREGFEVRGPATLHRGLAQLLRPRKPTVRPGAVPEKRYTLTVENKPLRGAIGAIAAQLRLRLEIDPAIPATTLDSLVSFKLTDATLDELFRAAAAAGGLQATVADGVVRLGP